MTFIIELSGNLKEIAGKSEFLIDVDSNEINLRDVTNKFFTDYGDIKIKFKQNGILNNDGMIKALIVVEEKLIGPDTIIHKNSTIRILPQICGG